MAKKFRYSHLKSTQLNAVPSAEKLRDAEIAVNVAKGGEKLFIKNTEGEVVPFISEEQIDIKLANKTDYIVNGGSGRALMFNETDGGGAKFEHNDGTWSFVGVNDGGENGIAGQIYAVKKNAENKYEGAKIDITKGGMYYTVGDAPASERDVPENEIAVKGDIVAATSDYFDGVEYDSSAKTITFYNGDTEKAFIDTTDFVIDGMIDSVSIETLSGASYLVIVWNTDAGKEEVDIPIADIFDASNYYTKDETDDLLDEKQDVLEAGEGIDITNNVISVTAETIVDQDIISGSTNAVAGGAVYEALVEVAEELEKKQENLVSGENIKKLTKNEYDLLGSGTLEISITDLSTDGEFDVDTIDSGDTVILEAGEF